MESLRELEAEYNDGEGTGLTGSVPREWVRLSDTLSAILLAGNSLEGDLYPLGPAALVRVSVHDNPGLCGMVPSSVRWAKGFNPHNTALGRPCPGEDLRALDAAPPPAP